MQNVLMLINLSRSNNKKEYLKWDFNARNWWCEWQRSRKAEEGMNTGGKEGFAATRYVQHSCAIETKGKEPRGKTQVWTTLGSFIHKGFVSRKLETGADAAVLETLLRQRDLGVKSPDFPLFPPSYSEVAPIGQSQLTWEPGKLELLGI